jgi:hypothetical protein
MVNITCDNCGRAKDKHLSQIKRTKNNFCSRECAGAFNGRARPIRKRKGRCEQCHIEIFSHLKFCDDCRSRGKDLTLAEAIYKEHHKSSAFALVRTRARAVAKLLGWSSCERCGYDRHFEIAHRKPIRSYPEDTKISTINDPSNLMPLCPNCHWEFDHPSLVQDKGIEPIDVHPPV